MSTAKSSPLHDGGLHTTFNASATHQHLSPLRAASTLLRYAPLILLLSIVAASAAVIHSVLQPRTYTASGSFVPNSARSAPNISGLAAQFGLSVPAPQGGRSPQFYAELIGTRTILDRVASAAYPLPGSPGRTGSLAQVLGRTDFGELDARRFVESALRAGVSTSTGTVTVAATTTVPGLSAAMARTALAALDEFNRQNQRTQAAAERQFTERRLGEAKVQLDSEEGRLRDFLQRNRAYETSPQLVLDYGRLQRNELLAQTLYASLAQSYEQARIEEVRDRPEITIIDQPEVPAIANARGTVGRGLLAALLGAGVGLIIMLVREYIEYSRTEHAPELEELSSVRGELLRSIRHPWRLIQRAERESGSTET